MNRSVKLTLVFAAMMLASAPSAFCKTKEPGVREKVRINTPHHHVWKILTNADKFNASIQTEKKNEAIVEQRFKTLPIYGTAITTLKVTAVPRTSITYEMLNSNKLKAMSGGWKLTPLNENTTDVELYSYVDPGLPVPQMVVNHFVRRKVKGRLKKTKLLAESSYKQQKANEKPAHLKTAEKP